MKKYRVLIREVHVSHRIVEAEDPEDAMYKAGEVEETELEYSHTMSKDCWTVEPLTPEELKGEKQ